MSQAAVPVSWPPIVSVRGKHRPCSENVRVRFVVLFELFRFDHDVRLRMMSSRNWLETQLWFKSLGSIDGTRTDLRRDISGDNATVEDAALVR